MVLLAEIDTGDEDPDVATGNVLHPPSIGFRAGTADAAIYARQQPRVDRMLMSKSGIFGVS